MTMEGELEGRAWAAIDLDCRLDGFEWCGQKAEVSHIWTAVAATKWKDSVLGTHVEYDQRPDVFRWGSALHPFSVHTWSLDVGL